MGNNEDQFLRSGMYTHLCYKPPEAFTNMATKEFHEDEDILEASRWSFFSVFVLFKEASRCFLQKEHTIFVLKMDNDILHNL